MLRALEAGDAERSEELLTLVYDELRALARAHMAREKHGRTLQATELVHEAWLRVAGANAAQWNGRAHFFGAAARAMRRILAEPARRRARVRHGAGPGRGGPAGGDPGPERPAARPGAGATTPGTTRGSRGAPSGMR